MVNQKQPALTISEAVVDWQEPVVLQRKCGHPLPALTDIGPSVAASKHATPPDLHPVSIHQMSPLQAKWQNQITAYYSFIDLERMKG